MADSPSDPAERLVLALAVGVLDSFEKLEVVQCLQRTPGARTAEQIAAQTGLPLGDAREAVEELVGARAVRGTDAGYQLDDGGPWAEHLTALAALDRRDRMQVVTLMSTAALERMRDRASRAFSDAFLIRSKMEDDDG